MNYLHSFFRRRMLRWSFFSLIRLINHRLTNLDPIDLNQSGFQADSLFACMITFVEGENV